MSAPSPKNDYLLLSRGQWDMDAPKAEVEAAIGKSAQAKAIAKWSKADVKDVPATLALYTFPTAEEQLGAKWLGGGAAKAMKDTATFLKEQGRITEVKPDYGAFVTTEYIKKALGK